MSNEIVSMDVMSTDPLLRLQAKWETQSGMVRLIVSKAEVGLNPKREEKASIYISKASLRSLARACTEYKGEV
jgi:hypothetical protein